MISADEWIKKLKLKPHPEGGFFAETYRSSEEFSMEALPSRYGGKRVFGTGIYYLIPSEIVSSLHRLNSDEVWHFYHGAPIEILRISPSGELNSDVLGDLTDEKSRFQAVVPAGSWFGARCLAKESYSLVGCTVAPGFDFDDFELADKSNLLSLYPQHQKTIQEFFPDKK